MTTIDEDGFKYLTNDVQKDDAQGGHVRGAHNAEFPHPTACQHVRGIWSMPQQYQVVALPYLLQLMDIPDKDEIITAIKDAQQNQTRAGAGADRPGRQGCIGEIWLRPKGQRVGVEI